MLTNDFIGKQNKKYEIISEKVLGNLEVVAVRQKTSNISLIVLGELNKEIYPEMVELLRDLKLVA